jgi:hypothetical protein
MFWRNRVREMARNLTGQSNEYGELPLRPVLGQPVGGGNTSRYLPWYELDPERYEAEDQAMRERGFAGRIYQDGRLVYGGVVRDAMVVVFLDHLNPVKPPSLFIISDNLQLPREAFNPDGSVDLFYGNHHWDPNELTASILISWLEELLSQSDDGNGASVAPPMTDGDR